jgi:hypothetical protein
VPPAAEVGHTGAPVALVLRGGDEQARDVVVALVLAIAAGDEAEVARWLAERVSHAQGGALHTSWTRAVLARQLVQGAASSALDPDATFESLVLPETMRVIDAGTHFTAGRPDGIDATDEVVLFTPTAIGRRVLAGLGGIVVVRPGPEPLVVGR